MKIIAWICIIISFFSLIVVYPILGLVFMGVVGIGLLAQFQED